MQGQGWGGEARDPGESILKGELLCAEWVMPSKGLGKAEGRHAPATKGKSRAPSPTAAAQDVPEEQKTCPCPPEPVPTEHGRGTGTVLCSNRHDLIYAQQQPGGYSHCTDEAKRVGETLQGYTAK